jgi:5-methylcytosine-specific restriction enzyme subunit McrC
VTPLRRTTYSIEEFKRRVLTAADLVQDGRLDIYPELIGKDLFRVDFGTAGFSVLARGHLGLIPINNRIAIEVTPRVPLGNVEEMLVHAARSEPLQLSVGSQSFRESAVRPKAILDLFARQFVNLCEAIRVQGIYREYRRVSETGTSPRGRIDPYLSALGRAKGNPSSAQWTTFDRTRDNGPNRLIRCTINVLIGQYLRMEGRAGARRLASLLASVDAYWPDVQICPISEVLNDSLVREPERIPVVRSSTRAAVELAKVILSGKGVELRSNEGPLELPILLINMETVFEEYTRYVIQVEFQSRGQFLVVDGNIGGPLGGRAPYFASVSNASDVKRFATPDILIKNSSGQTLIVGDMKYVPYEGKPRREDLDQVLTYSIVYGCKDVLLIYPADKSGTGRSEAYAQVGGVSVHVFVVDLSPTLLTQAIREQVASLHAMCVAKFTAPSLQLASGV